jgi:hypothetical protein
MIMNGTVLKNLTLVMMEVAAVKYSSLFLQTESVKGTRQ